MVVWNVFDCGWNTGGKQTKINIEKDIESCMLVLDTAKRNIHKDVDYSKFRWDEKIKDYQSNKEWKELCAEYRNWQEIIICNKCKKKIFYKVIWEQDALQDAGNWGFKVINHLENIPRLQEAK